MFADNAPLPKKPTIAIELGKKSASILFYSPGADFFACPRVQVAPEKLSEPQFLPELGNSFGFAPETPVLVAQGAKQNPALYPDFLKNNPSELQTEEFFKLLAPIPLMDSFCARLHGLVYMPGIQKRSFREGVTVMHVGKGQVHAALVFKNIIYGYFTVPFLPAETLQEHLEAFRLAWLPKEKAEAAGGHCFLPASLPAEAEGFKPLYIFGSNAEALKHMGQVVNLPFDQQFLGCWGLLFTKGKA